MAPATISVIIPTYRRAESIRATFESLCTQTLPYSQFEVIVVDDASRDGTVEALRELSAAKNRGALSSNGDYLLFLDDDMVCAPNLLEAHLVAHSRQTHSTVIFGSISANCREIGGFSAERMATHLNETSQRFTVQRHPLSPDDAWVGPNSSLPRELFFEYEGFDQINFARRCEDSELGYRLYKGGVRFNFEPLAISSHRWLKSERQAWRDGLEDGKAVIVFCRKHPEFASRVPGLIKLARAPFYRKWIAGLISAFPRSIGVPLKIIIAVAERLPPNSRFRRAGRHLHGRYRAIATLAGARQAAGSWRILLHMFGP
jgi:glycosyltransferase involved in cell wall biosynthesis